MDTSNATPAINLKIPIIVSYILIIAALVYLYFNSPVTGYELSIYMPILPFWVLIFLAISIGILMAMYMSYTKNFQYMWFVLFIIILGVFIILTLPITRGYFLYGGNDPTAHYNKIVSIVKYGYFWENYYPVTHIIGAELVLFSGILPETIAKLIPPILTVIFIIFSFFLAKAVFNKYEYAIIAAILSCIPLFTYYHVSIYPHATALFLLPIVFYFYFRSMESSKYRLLLIIMLVVISFVHVIPSLIIVGCLVGAEITRIALEKLNYNMIRNIFYNPAAIAFIVFFAWWSSYAVFGNVERAYSWFNGEVQMVPRTAEVETVSSVSQTFMIELYTKMYGNQLVMTLVSILAIGIMLYYLFRCNEELTNSLIMSSVLLISGLIYILIFLSGGFITIGRLFGANYGVWAMPVVAAFLIKKINKNKLIFISVTFLIILLFTIGMLGVYKSAWISQPNWHSTYQDNSANNWEIAHKSNLNSKGVIGSPWGIIPTGSWSWSSYVFIPAHFGYGTNEMFGQSVYKDSIIYYGEARQKAASSDESIKNSTIGGTWALPGFNSEDFDKIYYDKSVNYIFSNGDVKILLVKGLKGEEEA